MSTSLGTVWFEGRRYQLVMGESNCGSQKHRHPEPHADDSDGTVPHHHHDEHCAEMPRQATLMPMWEGAERHAHQWAPDTRHDGEICPCGGYRETEPEGIGKHNTRPGKVAMRYEMPADAGHPDGWSYKRWEDQP